MLTYAANVRLFRLAAEVLAAISAGVFHLTPGWQCTVLSWNLLRAEFLQQRRPWPTCSLRRAGVGGERGSLSPAGGHGLAAALDFGRPRA